MASRRRHPRTAAAVPVEVELKFAVDDPVVLAAWLDGPWAAAIGGVVVEPGGTAEVEDLYVDTPRGALARHGFAARLRRRGTSVTLTLKSTGGSLAPADEAAKTAVRRRIELEGPATMRLDPDGWPSSPARALLDELRGAAGLRPRFSIHQRRHERSLVSDASRVLVTLDEVEVHAGRRTLGAFAALEIEHTTGDEDLLHRVADAISASGLVRPDPRSKEAMAQALVERDARDPAPIERPKVPRTAGVRADDPLSEAGRRVLRLHVARMLAHEAGTRSGADPEDLHKMRVATRRMRSAWRIFADGYRPRVMRRYVRELRVVAAALGRVRDLDVIIEGIDAAAVAHGGGDALRPFRDSLTEQRAVARTDLLALLDSRAYRDFVEDYLDFTETEGAGRRPVTPGSPILVRDTAGSRIWAAWERVRAHDAALAWADATALHALRIDLKRLRYTIEAFREVVPATAGSVIAEVVAIQDHLGLLNDADVAAGVARRWLIEHAGRLDPATVTAVSGYLAAKEGEVRRLRRGVPAMWRRLTRPAFRRRLGTLIAGL